MTLHERIVRARRRLEAAGIGRLEAAVDAELLARTVLGWDRATLLASSQLPPPPDFQAAFDSLIARRSNREPAAYIVGVREFWNRDFEVGPGVLVPRPETEIIVEEALSRLAGESAAWRAGTRRHQSLVADVGTGSGCLAVSLALELDARVVATDASPRALHLARRNAERHEAADRIQFVETNLLSDVDSRFDLVVSNPPYIPSAEMALLPPEVREYEPREALAGGADGLGLIRDLLLQAESRLSGQGWLIFEFGFGQEQGVRDVVASRPAFRVETIRRDLQGIPRTAVLRFTPTVE